MSGLEIDSHSSSRTAHIGRLARKHTSYDVWSIGDDDAEFAGGEELRGLSCLLPRRRKDGKLYIGEGLVFFALRSLRSHTPSAPKRISRQIVISAQPSIATAPEHQPVVYQNPPRPSYPKDVLKHTFIPYGARSEKTLAEDSVMDVDEIETIVDKPAEPAPTPKNKPEKTKESNGKKRKVDGESPKKSKKHKPST